MEKSGREEIILGEKMLMSIHFSNFIYNEEEFQEMSSFQIYYRLQVALLLDYLLVFVKDFAFILVETVATSFFSYNVFRRFHYEDYAVKSWMAVAVRWGWRLLRYKRTRLPSGSFSGLDLCCYMEVLTCKYLADLCADEVRTFPSVGSTVQAPEDTHTQKNTRDFYGGAAVKTSPF